MKYVLINVLLLCLFTMTASAKEQTLIVAGGCFWCVEKDFESVPGVLDVVSGYINGHKKNPTYQEVARKQTGHYEAVHITYDDAIVSLRTLVDYFWLTIDPTDGEGQFCDRGSPYYTALFYQNDTQKTIFTASLHALQNTKPFTEEVVTPIVQAQKFYVAEEYHQNYYKKSRLRYNYYRLACGRDERIKNLWGSVASKNIKKHFATKL